MHSIKTSPYKIKTTPWSSHSQIIQFLETFPKKSRILDIGTAEGNIGISCQHLDMLLYGIEPEETWAIAARPYYENIFIGTSSDTPSEKLSNFDGIILGDVLEHMPNPSAELARLVSLQTKKTRFIISVPNIANLWIRLTLLFGNFNYTDNGILDRTHLRFFTRKTIKAMILDSGLTIKSIQPTPIPIQLVHPVFETSIAEHTIHKFLFLITRIFPTLFGYQFIIEAEKTQDG